MLADTGSLVQFPADSTISGRMISNDEEFYLKTSGNLAMVAMALWGISSNGGWVSQTGRFLDELVLFHLGIAMSENGIPRFLAFLVGTIHICMYMYVYIYIYTHMGDSNIYPLSVMIYIYICLYTCR